MGAHPCRQINHLSSNICHWSMVPFVGRFICWLQEGNWLCPPSSILLNKLQDIGLDDHLVRWISDYLTDRKQFVVINGVLSLSPALKISVSQGSVQYVPIDALESVQWIAGRICLNQWHLEYPVMLLSTYTPCTSSRRLKSQMKDHDKWTDSGKFCVANTVSCYSHFSLYDYINTYQTIC